eukprot:COSAG06_NODE_2473_length_6799_cov_3.380299_5_plen_133_part_00
MWLASTQTKRESSTCTHRDQVLLQVRDRVVEAALALHRRQMRLQLCEVTLLGMRASGEEQERRRAEAAGGSDLGHVSPRGAVLQLLDRGSMATRVWDPSLAWGGGGGGGGGGGYARPVCAARAPAVENQLQA